MLNKVNYQANGDGMKPYLFFDEETKRKIRRHIRDINDVITEKDIKNAKVPGLDEHVTLPSTHDNPQKKDNNGVDDTPGNPATAWDVLDE